MKALVRGVAIGTKIESLAVNCDEPSVTVATEPRLRITGHGKPSSFVLSHDRAGPKGSLTPPGN